MPHAGLDRLHVTPTFYQQCGEVMPQAMEVKLVHLAHLVHGPVNDEGGQYVRTAMAAKTQA
jgi:hypothetical protein